MRALPTKVELPSEHPLAKPIARFIAELAAQGKSPHTLRGYRADLAQLASYHDGGTSDLDTDVLRGFFASTRHQAPATRARKQAAVGAFLGWCCREQLLPSNPMLEIARVPVPRWSARSRLDDPAENGAAAVHGRRLPPAALPVPRDRPRSGLPGLVPEPRLELDGTLPGARPPGVVQRPGTAPGRVHGGLVGKAVRVLAVLASAARPCGLTEVASRTPVPKATAYRLLHTLCEQGLVARSGVQYVLGDQLVRLAAAAHPHSDAWRGIAVPYLVELYQVNGGVVSLGVLVDGQVRYVQQLYGHRVPRAPSRTSQVAPAHCTAIGKLLLAHLPERGAGDIVEGPLPTWTPRTISTARALRAELAGIRKAGVAFGRQEYVPGLGCVAVPVLGQDGQVIAGLAVGDDVSRLAVDRAVRQARRTALALSVVLRRAGAWNNGGAR